MNKKDQQLEALLRTEFTDDFALRYGPILWQVSGLAGRLIKEQPDDAKLFIKALRLIAEFSAQWAKDISKQQQDVKWS
jgi:hypothetical protein